MISYQGSPFKRIGPRRFQSLIGKNFVFLLLFSMGLSPTGSLALSEVKAVETVSESSISDFEPSEVSNLPDPPHSPEVSKDPIMPSLPEELQRLPTLIKIKDEYGNPGYASVVFYSSFLKKGFVVIHSEDGSKFNFAECRVSFPSGAEKVTVNTKPLIRACRYFETKALVADEVVFDSFNENLQELMTSFDWKNLAEKAEVESYMAVIAGVGPLAAVVSTLLASRIPKSVFDQMKDKVPLSEIPNEQRLKVRAFLSVPIAAVFLVSTGFAKIFIDRSFNYKTIDVAKNIRIKKDSDLEQGFDVDSIVRMRLGGEMFRSDKSKKEGVVFIYEFIKDIFVKSFYMTLGKMDSSRVTSMNGKK